jgi:ABC-type antimicrobial peptide transport system ATPase subunit
MAKTLVFLKDNNIDSYDELVQKSSAATSNFLKKSTRLNEIEARQKEISELQKQIGTYGKTREVYKKYLASGRDQSFHDVHAADIILHEAAKKHFNKLGYGKERSC